MRPLLPGTWLDMIAGSLIRHPSFKVWVWDPTEVTIGELAGGRALAAPRDLTPYVLEVSLTDNVGYENQKDPSTPAARFTFLSDPNGKMRRGLVEDGVIVRVMVGDRRINPDDWTVIFTGTFRGRPQEDPGTRGDRTKGLEAIAHGREERYTTLQVTTRSFPANTDVGAIALAIAREHMNLEQDEVLIGAQGFPARHNPNQIVETPALQAVYDCLFPVGKKPRFNAMGQLVAVDARLDKAAARIYPTGNPMVRSMRARGDDGQTNNTVILRGLSHILTKITQETQRLTEFQLTTGWFERSISEDIYYSFDRTQRAEDTYLVTVKRIRWSDADWEEVDEFHGTIRIDTRHQANVQTFLLVTHLAARIAIALIDLIVMLSGGSLGTVMGIIRYGLEIAAWVALLGFMWSVSQVDRGRYEVWGRPFEYVFQELVAKDLVDGLTPEQERIVEYRNDFMSTMPELTARAKEMLRRELVKDQLWEIEILDDPLLEVDDVIELANGDRFYIVSAARRYRRGEFPILQLTTWKVDDAVTRLVDAVEVAGAAA